MPRKKKANRKKGPPDPRSRDSFYLVRVTDFFVRGSADRWYPEDLPNYQLDDYLKAPIRPLLKTDIDLDLVLQSVDPPFPEVTDCTAILHGSRRDPEPDWEFFGGSIYKRKDRLQFWFHSSLDLTTGMGAVLIAGRQIWIRFQGSRLYRGKASICGLEWWESEHPDLLEELVES